MRILKALLWAFVAAIVASVLWGFVLLAFGIDVISFTASGSGGLGAVSAGFSEALVEAGIIVFVIVFVWRMIRTRRRDVRKRVLSSSGD